jgi:hypothetical protein
MSGEEHLETCWRMRKGDRILECAIYATAFGVELRAGYGADELMKSQLFADAVNAESPDARARAVAEQWRRQIMAAPGFEQLPTWGPRE